MDTGVINPGNEGKVSFLEPGEYRYYVQLPPGDARARDRYRQVEGDARSESGRHPGQPHRCRWTSRSLICVRSGEGDSRRRRHCDLDQHRARRRTRSMPIGRSPTSSTPAIRSRTLSTKAGTFEYQCGLHPAMVGTIEVVEAVRRLPNRARPRRIHALTSANRTIGQAEGPFRHCAV